MVRIALFACLLGGLLAATPAQASWPFWLSKPERHGQRKLAGDYTHINTTYRYHSRERHGLFSFLHLGSQRPVTARHRSKGPAHAAKTGRKHTTGLF